MTTPVNLRSVLGRELTFAEGDANFQNLQQAVDGVSATDPGKGANLVGYLAPFTGAVATTQHKKNQETISVEDFGAVGDGVTDDMAAFQRAANYLYTRGGGVLRLTKPSYYLEKYTAASVSGTVLGYAVIVDSKCWCLPANTLVEGNNAVISIKGGASSPFGYSLGVNVLAFPPVDDTILTTVSAVSRDNRQVTVASSTGFTVGQIVSLGRKGGITGSIPNTPSQERSPHQLMTIKTIAGPTITFEESFIHKFEYAQDLQLQGCPGGVNQPTNIYIQNCKFKKVTTAPYILFSRVLGCGFDNVTFDQGVFWSIGMCQTTRLDRIIHNTNDTDQNIGTIEATSDIRIGQITVNGNGSTNPLGGVFFSDNCRAIRMDKYSANNLPKTGLSMFYGIEAEIGEAFLADCGTTADVVNEYTGAVTLGHPAMGAMPSYTVSSSATYKVQNVPNSSIRIHRLRVVGGSQVPVRSHDCALQIDNAEIDFSNPGGSGVFVLGQSGERRADATYFPLGGLSSTTLGLIRVKGISGTQTPVIYTNGYAGSMIAGTTTLTAPATAGTNTITVADPDLIPIGVGLRYTDEAGTTFNSQGVNVSSVAGSVVTLAANLACNLTNGQIVTMTAPNPKLTANITAQRFEINGVATPFPGGYQKIYPNLVTGAGPYTTIKTLTVPGNGEWNLEVSAVTNDNAHYITNLYRITYNNINGTYPLSGLQKIGTLKVRTNADITAESIADNVVSLTLSCSSTGKSLTMNYRWTQLGNTFNL